MPEQNMNQQDKNQQDMLREERVGTTHVLTMNYPERRNAFAIPMRARFVEALDRVEGDPDVRAIVITGAGGNFSSGGDISGMGRRDTAQGRERFRQSHRVIRLLTLSSKPIIAAIEGWAAGAGLSLAALSDTVIAAEDSRFVCSFNRVGLMPDLGLLHTLPQRVGMGAAKQIMFYGETFDAAHAHRIGLVDRVVPKGQALEVAMERAAKFAEAAPLPIAMMRRYLAQGIEAALDLERDLQLPIFMSDDHSEGAAAFMDKRAPRFRGT